MARSKNPIRFGINPRNLPYGRVVEIGQAAEDSGFQTIGLSDRPPENNLEGWTLATAVAVQTQRIIVTHSTLNVPFRNPALLSKMAAALDHISAGRLLLTLGAGIQENHFTTYGIDFGTPGQRVDGLIDAIEILRGTWANESFTYNGKVYSVSEAVVTPRPPRPIPIAIGAGKPRTLRLAGRMADGWIRNGGFPESVEQYTGLLSQMEEGAASAGRDPGTIRRILNCTAYIGPDDPADHVPATFGSPFGLLGTPDQVRETVERFREAGADTFHVQFDNSIMDEQIEAFGREVISRVQ